jgi:histidinol-phosphate/aromatic aminotransferase/cobyric acid decarboxylase-like protein
MLFDRTDNIYLNLNEFKYEHCEDVKNTKIDVNMITNYYDVKSTIELIKHIAVYNKVYTDNILLVNGGDSAIDVVVKNHNITNAKILEPTYGYYKDSLDNKVKFESNPDIIFICNPNNPDGSLHTPQKIEQELMNNKDTVYVIDETYMDFKQLLGDRSYTCCNLLLYPNLYIIKSFSKAFGIAGMRLGYIISKNSNINKIKYNPKNVLEISKLIGIKIMHNLEHYKNQVIKMNNDKKKLTELLDEYKITYIDTCTNFICIKTKDVQDFLENSKPFIFRDISNRKNMNKYIRVTICDNIYKIIKYRLLI